MISKKKLIKHLQEMDRLVIKYLESKTEEESKRVYNEFKNYLFKDEELIENLDLINYKYSGFFTYAEKIRIGMEEGYRDVLESLLNSKDIELSDVIIAGHYQEEIDKIEFTREVIDNLSEEGFFNYLDKLYFLKDFYTVYEEPERLEKINFLMDEFIKNKNYGKRYFIDEYLEEKYPDVYALLLSVRKDIKGSNEYAIKALERLKKSSTYNEIQIFNKDIEFLKKNKNHYLLFNNTEPIDESIFRFLCQEYCDRTGILERDITWFNEALSKGYALLSLYWQIKELVVILF